MKQEFSLNSAQVSAHPQKASVSSAYTVTVYRDPLTLKKLPNPKEFKYKTSDEAQQHAQRLLKTGLKHHDFTIQASNGDGDLHGLVGNLREKDIEVEKVVLCPWCLSETGEYRPMVFRDMPDGRHYYCTRCGKRLEAD